MIRFSGLTLSLLGDQQTITEVKGMMLAHLARTEKGGANLSKEFIGVKLNGYDISTLLKDYGAKDLVALFAVEKESQTIILMGLGSDGKLLKDNHGDYAAIERWGGFSTTLDKLKADPETEFGKIFP